MEATFAEKLKRWRKAHRLSQKRAAELLEVSRSYLNQVERGMRSPGDRLVNTFQRIVDSENIDQAIEAVHCGDWQKAFQAFVEGAPPALLLSRLVEITGDESKSLSERNELTRLILPVIQRRVRELQRDLAQAEPETDRARPYERNTEPESPPGQIGFIGKRASIHLSPVERDHYTVSLLERRGGW